MSTILIINAVSSLVAGLGVAGWVDRKRRQAERETPVEPVYVTRD
jgi:hypothetical protein